MEKARLWRGVIHEAARSGLSIREFCRQRKLRECQFYWWQRKLTAARPESRTARTAAGEASFALVSGGAARGDAGIELVLAGGRRLRIARGVDEQTLRAVLAAMDAGGC